MDPWNEDPPSVLICYPGMGAAHEISEKWAESLHNIRVAYPNATTLSVIGYPLDVARNNCAIACMEKNFEYLFFLDQDVIAPADIIQRLLSHQTDVVGGIYRTKTPPYHWCAFMGQKDLSGLDTKIQITPTGGLVNVDYLGTGCLLIHRRVFQTLAFPWFKWTLSPVTKTGKSEDFYFTDLCKKNGIGVFADTDAKCDHVCATILTENGFEPL